MNLIQLSHPEHGRRIARVEEGNLHLAGEKFTSIYQMVTEVLEKGTTLTKMLNASLSEDILDYNAIYKGESDWKILPAFDHPEQPAMCVLSGTGLTHKASAENRQKMHTAANSGKELNDSIEMYLWGEKGGKPENGKIGVQPEWFYKGNGSVLKGHLEALSVPAYADDGGEEAEIAGIYVIDSEGNPVRVGFATANEFSDHVMEKKNYLYLAPSKLRECAIGPELILGLDFKDIPGKVSVERKGDEIWSSEVKTGENNITHHLSNLEYHHFKYKQHRLPGQVHIHFFGTGAFSYGAGIKLEEGDRMKIDFPKCGRPLINFIKVDGGKEEIIEVRELS
ncbi:AraD1 family protein [Flexithrix dorotheae]|uniref:AraD1 family protein n=1 Tax=Flexithrix dorotheae TaxID=70993 RepID=UPI00037D86D2|nr:AraD1 family protein [Flexithrix dorotheae]